MTLQYSAFAGDTANEGELREHLQLTAATGIAPGRSDVNTFGVTASGSDRVLTIDTGLAFVSGHRVKNTSASTVTVSAADPTDDRIDIVCIRVTPTADLADPDDDNVEVVIVEGTAAGSPVAPTLTQDDDGIFEFPLAEVVVTAADSIIESGDLTDQRSYTRLGSETIPFAAVSDGGNTKVDIGTSLTDVHTLTIVQGAAEPGDVFVAEFWGYIQHLGSSGSTISAALTLGGSAVMSEGVAEVVGATGAQSAYRYNVYCRVLVSVITTASQTLTAMISGSESTSGLGTFRPQDQTAAPLQGSNLTTINLATGNRDLTLRLRGSNADADYYPMHAVLLQIKAPL